MRLPIQTERLELREVRKDDLLAIHAFRSDAAVTRYMFFDPETMEETSQHLDWLLATQACEPRRAWELAVVRSRDGQVIGGCDLNIEQRGEADLGYILARRAWGHGYATEIATELVDHGFRRLGLHRIFATCDPDNAASRRVLRKAGLCFKGRIEQHRYTRGRWWSSELHAIGLERWTAERDGVRPDGSDESIVKGRK